MKTLKVLGLLLTYPCEEMMDALDDMEKALNEESWLPEKNFNEISALFDKFRNTDIYDLQEDYVALFDRTPSLSLYLFEHIHGDSRERGQALVDLDALYKESKLMNFSEHTPDYLPLFLEYLSLLPSEQAWESLSGPVDVIAALAARLEKRGSLYARVLEALPVLCGTKPDKTVVKNALAAADGSLPDLEEVDATWEEQFALENPLNGNDSGCPKAREILARMEENIEEVQP
jgi:nitrate reductase delta subunit